MSARPLARAADGGRIWTIVLARRTGAKLTAGEGSVGCRYFAEEALALAQGADDTQKETYIAGAEGWVEARPRHRRGG